MSREPAAAPSIHWQWGLVELVFVFAIAGIFVVRISWMVVDPDLYHEMALARESIAQGAIPYSDPFAFTPTIEPMVQHEWGAGFIALLLVQFLGSHGIVALKWGLAFGAFLLTGMTAVRRGASLPVLGLLSPIPIFLADEGFSPVRAQMYSFVCCAWLLLWLDAERRDRHTWFLPWLAIYLFWLNVHAGFLVGAGLYLLHWIEQWLRGQFSPRLFAGGCLMVMLICVNPYGWHYFTYLFQAVTLDRPHISEWAPLWVASPPHHLVAFVLALALTIWAAVCHGWRNLPGLPLVLLTAFYAIRHGRMLPFFSIVWCAYVPAYLEQTSLGKALAGAWHNHRPTWAIVWTVAALALIYSAAQKAPWRLVVPGTEMRSGAVVYPVGPAAYLRNQGFSGNVWTPFDQGAYVSWQLFPRVRVSMDSRYEVAYPPGALEQNHAFYVGQLSVREAISDNTDAVLSMQWMPAVDKLRTAPEWTLAYIDDAFVLYLRPDLADALPFVDRRGEWIEGRFP